MPASLTHFDNIFLAHLRALNTATFLDIGCGCGNYGPIVRNGVPGITRLDAVEPTESYIKEYDLLNKYNTVYNCTIQDFLERDINILYDVTYCSDVLEHLFLSEAIDTIDSLLYYSKWAIIKWPTNYVQGWHKGNFYEKHKSNILLSDLTRFNIHYYTKIALDPGVEYHYCVISGFRAGNKYLLG